MPKRSMLPPAIRALVGRSRTSDSAVVVLNLSLFYGLGGDVPPPARTFTLVDAAVLLSFAHLGVFAWHARVLSRMMPDAFIPLSSRQ